MDTLWASVLTATRQGLIRRKPIFQPFADASPEGLADLERQFGRRLPEDLRQWLLTAGYGDINEQLSFRQEWFSLVQEGQLSGAIIFAQDLLGNFYAVSVQDSIYYLSRSAPEFAVLASSFREFLKELVSRKYELLDWIGGLSPKPIGQ